MSQLKVFLLLKPEDFMECIQGKLEFSFLISGS